MGLSFFSFSRVSVVLTSFSRVRMAAEADQWDCPDRGRREQGGMKMACGAVKGDGTEEKNDAYRLGC